MDLIEKSIEYETLLLKNNTMVRVGDRIELRNESSDVLQICNSVANVKIDEMTIVHNGINIEGVLELNIIYISSKDNSPINSINHMVPFNHIV